jgi:hypothetical protein
MCASTARAALYTVDPQPLQGVDAWLDLFRSFWEPKLSALETEIARGKSGAAANSLAIRHALCQSSGPTAQLG